MPKKKPVTKPVKKVAARKAVAKSVGLKKGTVAKVTTKKAAKKAAKKTSKPSKAAGQPSVSTETKKSVAAVPQSAEPVKSEPSLGRPLVTQEEKLYMLFHDDYQARQVFEFLRVETVKELEHFSQQQILHMMSKPLRMTLDRIRQRLAQFKRSLKDDEQFAAEFLRHAETK